jgi:hypothetical protein
MQEIHNIQRHPVPTVAPQALAWNGKELWMSSRDLGTLFRIDTNNWKVAEEVDPPGVVWAAVATNDSWRLTVGKGLNDDRHVYRYTAGGGFEKLFACPEFTGSYLSFDGENLYLSQWHKGQIHRVDDSGNISRTIEVGAEICGHTFADEKLYVVRGRENKDLPNKSEEWRIAMVDLRPETSVVTDLATVPFASRSLTFDGERFWSNHRAANETVAFAIPG